MRRRRHKLEVSTFPFLAVLLCAMGSLILLLLVIDRRALPGLTANCASKAFHLRAKLPVDASLKSTPAVKTGSTAVTMTTRISNDCSASESNARGTGGLSRSASSGSWSGAAPCGRSRLASRTASASIP